MKHPTNPQSEEWRDVVDYEGVYGISNYGRVRRTKRSSGTPADGRLRVATQTLGGYMGLSLSHDGVPKRYLVHQLVASAFIGPCPDGFEVHHIDADTMNNHATNIRYVTHAENIAARDSAGRTARGETSGHAKLTAADVRTIRAAYPALGCTELGRRYGVYPSTIYAILKRRSWRHIE